FFGLTLSVFSSPVFVSVIPHPLRHPPRSTLRCPGRHPCIERAPRCASTLPRPAPDRARQHVSHLSPPMTNSIRLPKRACMPATAFLRHGRPLCVPPRPCERRPPTLPWHAGRLSPCLRARQLQPWSPPMPRLRPSAQGQVRQRRWAGEENLPGRPDREAPSPAPSTLAPREFSPPPSRPASFARPPSSPGPAGCA